MRTTIEMAREAAGDDWGLFQEFMPEIHRLAELVRADERARMAEQSAQQQEPVGMVKDLFTNAAWDKLDVRGSTKVYLDAPPAQRTWVGLTDEEITDIWAEASPYYHEDDFARAIEAKLKQRNT
jgi:hypothetical protein